MPTLNPEAVNKYVLHKHHLPDNSQGNDVLKVIKDIIALHATSVGTPYISLFARVEDFKKKDLDEQFYGRRNLVRLSAMRGTLFITPTETAPILFQATKMPEHQISRRLQRRGIPQSEYHEIAAKLTLLLEGGKTLPEIKKTMPKDMTRSVELKIGRTRIKMSNVNVVLNALMNTGMIISEKAPGTLQITKANRYMLLKEIYPKLNLDSVKREEARVALVQRYIRAFGPVTDQDIAWWTGFNRTMMKEILTTIEKSLLQVELDSFKEEYLMLEDDFKQFARFKPSKNSSVVLLPFEDPYTKGYKIRNRLVDKDMENKAYVGGGVLPTILLDGKIVGIWNRSIESGKGPIQLTFLLQHDEDVEHKAVKRAKAIGKLMADGKINVEVN